MSSRRSSKLFALLSPGTASYTQPDVGSFADTVMASFFFGATFAGEFRRAKSLAIRPKM